jgi:hypothetical protein
MFAVPSGGMAISSAFFPFLSAILVLILGHNPALERSVAPEAAD